MEVIKENKIDTRLFSEICWLTTLYKVWLGKIFKKLMEVKTHPWAGSKMTGTSE